jgi:hypothetical protein
MAKLVKPAVYAKETGISRQAVYAKIKRGTLKSKEVDDQLFIVVDSNSQTKSKLSQSNKQPQDTIAIDNVNDNSAIVNSEHIRFLKQNSTTTDIQALIDSKNETIETLKCRINDLKESNQQLTSVFRGEIDLLKDAFVEMKRIYVSRLESEPNKEIILENNYTQNAEDEKISWIGVKKFLKIYGYDLSNKAKVKDYLDFLHSAGDTRVGSVDGKIKINEKFCSEQIIKDALLD